MSARPTQPSVPSSWPVTFINLFDARSNVNGGEMYRRGGAKMDHGLGGSLSR